jgi:hypothetical protein
MAELLAADGWVKPGSPGAYLRETLPDGYYVVTEPRVASRRLAAAIVGHTGLFAVQAEDDDASDIAQHGRPAASNGNGAGHAIEEQTIRAVRQFLRDEFPELTPPICVVLVARDWASDIATWRVIEPREWMDQPLAETVMTADAQDFRFDGEDARAALAVGLRDRQLTASERAGRPFTFRTGRALRIGVRVTTIREAVAHMDRNPADGMHHLRDGTLAAWLEEEGAHHLAALARDVVHRPRTDMRVALEEFLLGAGLVARPRLRIKPEALDFGYVAQGQTVSRLLRLRKLRGRGYLFGTVSAVDSWLAADPRDFQGSPVDIVVSADTANLAIGQEPTTSELLLRTSASAEDIAVPVRVRIMPLPGAFVQWTVRPLIGLLAGLLMGLAVGTWWAIAGIGSGRGGFGLWPVLVGALWAVLGLTRALRQPPAWPTWYALKRWAARSLLWASGMALLSILLVLAWRAGLGGGLDLPGLTLVAAAAVAAAFGVIPATIDELSNSRHAVEPGYVRGRLSRRRQVTLAAAVVVFALVALLAPRFITPAAQEIRSGEAFAPAREWAAQRWQELNVSMDRFVDQVTLRYYERPAGESEQPRPRIELPGWLRGQ